MAYSRDDRGRGFVLERERSVSRERTPRFLREVHPEAGPMVIRQREVETASRRRHHSPDHVYVERREMVRRPSPSPAPTGRGRSVSRVRARVTHRDRSISCSDSSSSYCSSESYEPRRYFARPRSESPPRRGRDTLTATIRRESFSRSPSPCEPSPPPQPQVVRGPTIEREVITHYTDVDHGVVRARQPSPQPPPRARSKSRVRDRDTAIDIVSSRNDLAVDVRRTETHGRERSRVRDKAYADQSQLMVVDHHHHHRHKSRRRAHSSAPLFPAWDPACEEADYLTSTIDARGRMGEAHHGATRDWAIVDVPPGTERVTMDGAGGASTETTWQRYSGVRRTKFIPERDEEPEYVVEAPAAPEPRMSKDRLSIHVSGRRAASRPREREKWTEITRDLVNKEAIRRMGYQFEENGHYLYVMRYLNSREINQLVDMTEEIRRIRRLKKRQLVRDSHGVDHSITYHSHKHRHHHHDAPPHRFRHEQRLAVEEPRFEKQVSFERRREY